MAKPKVTIRVGKNGKTTKTTRTKVAGMTVTRTVKSGSLAKTTISVKRGNVTTTRVK